MRTTQMHWDEVLHQQVAAIGARMGGDVRDRTAALYLPLHDGASAHRALFDLHYGEHPRQCLDLHLPQSQGAPRPVLCFVHGGGFTGGDKRKPGLPFYDNIGRWAVEAGFIFANCTYRLAPEFPYPAGAQDVAAAVRYVQRRVADHGGDPGAVVVMGHSAGGAHVATFVADAALRASLPLPIRGAIVSSGIYDPSFGEDARPEYYGEDSSLWPGRAAIAGLCASTVPLLVSTAQLDPPSIQAQTAHLLDRLFAARGELPELVQADGHNHFSVMYQFATGENWYSERIARFVRRVTGPTAPVRASAAAVDAR